MAEFKLLRSNGQVLTFLPDQKLVKDVVSLTLVGRGAVNYGTEFAQSFVHLLENFAHLYPPQRPMDGQLWWDTGKERLKVYTNEQWRLVAEEGTPEAIPDTMVRRDADASFKARTVTAALKGNADTATAWKTPRYIILQGDVDGRGATDGTGDAVFAVTVNRSASADRLSGARLFTWTGDARGSLTFDGSGSVTAQLKVDRAASAEKILNSRAIALTKHVTGSGRFDGTADLSIEATLNDTGVVPGTYNTLTVDRTGRVTEAKNTSITRVALADSAVRADSADRARTADRADSTPYADRAGTADRLSTARRITLSGKVSGAAIFDGSSDIEIVTTGADTPQGDDKTTASNIGAGQGHVFAGMNGANLQFKTIKAGDNVSIVESGDVVQINSTATISGTVDRAREADHATNADYAQNAKNAETANTALNVNIAKNSATNMARAITTGRKTITNNSTTDAKEETVLSITLPDAGYARIYRYYYADLTQYTYSGGKSGPQTASGSMGGFVKVNGQGYLTSDTLPMGMRYYTFLEGSWPAGTSGTSPPGGKEDWDLTDLSGQQLNLVLNVRCTNNGTSEFTVGLSFLQVIVFIK